MKSKSCLWSLIATTGLISSVHAADVESFLVAKGQQFRQTNAAAPVQISAEEPFEARASVTPSVSGSVTGATLRLPNSQVVTLEESGDGIFEGEASFTTKSQLDAQAGAGTYNFTIQTLNDGTNRPSLSMPADNYPPTPRLSNWSDAQEIEASADFLLQWFPFTNGTANDFVVFSISDTNGQDVFSTPGFLETNVLNGTATSATLPANSLTPNSTYEGRLLFVKRTTTNTNSIPGAVGLAGYYKNTLFPLMTLAEEAGPGRIQLGASSFSVSEASPTELLVPIYRTSSSLTGAVSVTLTISDGTAHSGTDYQVNNLVSVVTFPDGIGYNGITVVPINNFLLDGNRSLTFSLSNPTDGAVLGNRSNAVVTILDDESVFAGKFQFNPAAITVTEAGKQALLTIARIGGSTGVASVGFYSAGVSATGGADFTPTNGILTFASGQTSRQITVPISDDGLDETNETFQVVLNATTGGAALGSNTTATVTITDNDDGGVIAFQSAKFSTNENAAAAIITLVRTIGKAGDVTIRCQTQDGLTNGATAGDDYQSTDVVVSFNTNELTKKLTIPLMNDFNVESNETVRLSLSEPTGGARLGVISNAVLTLLDDESNISLTNATYTVSEAGLAVSINAVRSGALITPVAVSYSTVDGSAVSTNDYRGTNGVLFFPPNVKFKTIKIPIVNDTIVDSNETFSVYLHSPSNGVTLGAITNTVVSLAENDAGGVISFAKTNFLTPEAGPAVAVTINRTVGKASGVSVWLSTADGSATAGQDYTAVSNKITFNANDTSKTIIIPVNNDTLDETNETVQLFLTGVEGGATLGSITSATLSITDNDTAGAFSLESASYATDENNAFFLITVTRGTTGKASETTVDFTTQDGVALAGLDYYPTNGTLTFGSNELSKVVTVVLTNDTLPEGNEPLSFKLSNPTGGATLGAISNATLTIRDDESSVSLTNAVYTVGEAGPSISINVIRSGALITPVSVGFSTVDAEAVSPDDYRGTNGTLVFPVNTAFKTITIPIVNDTIVEGGESFSLFLHSPSNGLQLGTLTNAVINIADNDQGGVFNFKFTAFTTNENNNAVIAITRTNGAASGASVDFSTQDGSATAGLDYALASQTVVFGAGQTSTNIVIPIINDALDETNETVQLFLSNGAHGATVGVVSNATLTINDDDSGGVFRFANASYVTNENAGAFLVNVVRSSGVASNVTVDFFTQDGTAMTSQPDYIATNGTLSFSAGETNKLITVPINNDTAPEGNETLSVILTNATGGATINSNNIAGLTIVDDESSVSFTNINYTISESAGSISINVVRSGALGTAVSVDYSVLNGTAVPPADYTSTNGTLTFPANTAVRTIVIPIKEDFFIEPLESFIVRLSNPQGGVQLGSTTNTTVFISDNDAPGTIKFSASTYSGNEGSSVGVTIQRTGGLADGVTVQFTMSGGSATSGTDYGNASQTVTFNGGESNKTINVNLNSDGSTEGTETVNLTLSSPGSNATLGSPNTATLSITEAPPANCPAITFNLSGPGMKCSLFTANQPVVGGLTGNSLTFNCISGGLTTKTITFTINSLAPGTTGTFPISSGLDFAGYSISTINSSTFCSNTKTYNSAFSGSGCITIVEWNTSTKTFKATFTFNTQGAASSTSCPGQQPVPGPVPTDRPSITGGQVWFTYY